MITWLSISIRVSGRSSEMISSTSESSVTVFIASALEGLLELLTWPAEEITRRMADEVSPV